MPEITIEEGDICHFAADVVVLKHAQDFYGADAAVAASLVDIVSYQKLSPGIGEHALVLTNGRLDTPRVLFLGTVSLYKFDYAEIRAFARRAVETVAKELPDTSHIALTMHGAGYGLDEREAFLAEIGGLLDELPKHKSIRKVSIVEKRPGRVQRLRAILNEIAPPRIAAASTKGKTPEIAIDAGIRSGAKKHVFVAIPFSLEFDDVYAFGIQQPINAAGYLCERVDMAVFTGDILERIKSRIDDAALVVADLTSANPNVYLEVGYAWGRGRPTLLLARAGEELKFDVRGHRCVIYESILDLSRKITKNLSLLPLIDDTP